MKARTDSPVVEEIRARAMRISLRFGNDPRRYLQHLKQAQKARGRKLVRQMTVV